MGFYSDVRIISRKKLAEDIKAAFKKHKFEPDRVIEHGAETVFDLFDIKWYPDYDIVRDIDNLLYDADEKEEEDYGYMYLIGNEDGTNESMMHPDSTLYNTYYNLNNVFFNLGLYRKIVALQKFLYKGHDFTDEECKRIMSNVREEKPFVLYFKSNSWSEEKYTLSIEEDGFKPEDDPFESYNVCIEIRPPQSELPDWTRKAVKEYRKTMENIIEEYDVPLNSSIRAVIIEEVAKTLAGLLEEFL